MTSRYLIAGAMFGVMGLIAAGNAFAGTITQGCTGLPETCNLLEIGANGQPAEVSTFVWNNSSAADWQVGYYVIYDPAPPGVTPTTISDVVVFEDNGNGVSDGGELYSYNDGGAPPSGLPDLNTFDMLGSAMEDGSGFATFSPLVTNLRTPLDTFNVYSSPEATPEPLTVSLFGAGLAGAVAMRRRKKRWA